MFHIPPRISFSKPCQRCGMRYPEREEECVHCKDLSDKELDNFKLERQEGFHQKTELGKLFFYICILLVIMLVVLNL